MLFGLTAMGAGSAEARLAARDLRCEYRVNPQGIDVPQPRLSWIVESSRRAESQTAYHILVSTSKRRLDDGVGDLWDTGRVESAETAQVPYRGVHLNTGQEAWWKVRCWDRDGKPGSWSKPARWSMGLLSTADWSAQWISAPAPTTDSDRPEPQPLTGQSWVWMPGENARTEAPQGTRFFRKVIDIPSGRELQSALFTLTADNTFTLLVNGADAGRDDGQADVWKHVNVLDVRAHLSAGQNVLSITTRNHNGPAGLVGRLDLRYADGKSQTIRIDTSWKASAEAPENWTGTAFDDSAWPTAEAVTPVGESPWGEPGGPRTLNLPPSPFLRTTFQVQKPVRRAVLYATALGLYEARLNGARVGEDVFRPGWTDYKTRLYYQTYDVTSQVKRGDNALGAILADGWALGYVGLVGRDRYGVKNPRLLMQLNIEYTDGSTETIGTNGDWKAAYGPILEADLLMGETHDARLEMPGWDQAAFDDADWGSVRVQDAWPAPLEAEPGVPVRVTQEIPTRAITEPTPGHYVFDLGQNMVGWARLKVNGPAGTKLTLRFAEILNPDGTIYTTNLRSARCTDTYILRGEGTETWEPRFTFHGFRYVEITGFPGKPDRGAITGIVAHSDTPAVGTFECSNPAINQLQSNIVWGQRGNFLEVPTDCPQRDERLGWMGDAQVFVRTASHNMDVSAFFTKWMVDVADAQRPDGAYTDVSPDVGLGAGTAAWADAGIVIPWTMYQVYGDTEILRKHYDGMSRFIDYLVAHSNNLLRPAEGYGDWLSINADTPKDVLSTACFGGNVLLMAKIARVLDKKDDARRFEDLFRKVAEAFQAAYVAPDGKIQGETQTVYVLALYWDLLPEDLRPAAVKHLVSDIESRNWRLSTGFVGTSLLLPVLTRFGRHDVAMRLYQQDAFPSWLFSVKHGATTIWERWDGWTPDKGFQDPGMNSFNHYAFGAVGAWMVPHVAGIDLDPNDPGFRRIIMRPRPGDGLTRAASKYDSIRGPIASSWEIKPDGFHYSVAVPANAKALVYVFASDPDKVLEGNKPASEAEGVRYLRMEDGAAVFEVGSGTYRFVAK